MKKYFSQKQIANLPVNLDLLPIMYNLFRTTKVYFPGRLPTFNETPF